MDLPSEQFFRVLAREAFVYRKALAVLFVLVTLSVVITGLFWPQRYTSSTTILVEDKNILQPLLKGTAVDTGQTSKASVARTMIYSHRIMGRVAVDAGWVNSKTTPKQESYVINRVLIPRTMISYVGDNKNLIKIEYSDSNPKRAYFTAKDLTNLFIATTLAAKAKESTDAFNFINQQVLQYRAKLADAENALKKFQSANLTTRPGSDGEIGKTLNQLQDSINKTSEELNETQIKQNSLTRQLSGESQATAQFMIEGQYEARIAKLQAQLAALRLNYRDTYPDIVHIRHQIADLKRDMQESQKEADEARSNGVRAVPNESLVLNPLYQHLRQELSQTETRIATLTVRLADYRKLRAAALKQGREVHSGEATLAELTRDYTVNRDIYQDLLRQRENARVTMNLDKQKEGLTFQIQSHAALPQEPEGLRFADFVFGGFFLGLALPLGLLYAKLKFDSRVFAPGTISEKLKLPLLAVIPHLFTPAENEETARNLRLLGVVVVVDVCVLVGISALKVAGVI